MTREEFLLEEGTKVTTRNIQARASVSVASVNKHYKAILNDLTNDKSNSIISLKEINTIEGEASNEADLTDDKADSNEIFNAFISLAE